MEEIQKRLDIELQNESELLAFYLEAIEVRGDYPEYSEQIARAVFDRAHPYLLSFGISEDASRLRDEFGALEAPGLPEDDSDPDVYRDQLWKRLKNLVNENRTA
jgi:hypothetical protein